MKMTVEVIIIPQSTNPFFIFHYSIIQFHPFIHVFQLIVDHLALPSFFAIPGYSSYLPLHLDRTSYLIKCKFKYKNNSNFAPLQPFEDFASFDL